MVNKNNDRWEGVKFISSNRNLILRKDVYNARTKTFLHSKPKGLFIPIKKLKRSNC